jgi:beta-phosphoglucomutase-like phosphatase (HAD superfamily)
VSAFPFDAVIFDMDGVIVDTEYYYLGETAAFAKELGLNLTQEELNGQVGTSHQFFLHMLVDWFALHWRESIGPLGRVGA